MLLAFCFLHDCNGRVLAFYSDFAGGALLAFYSEIGLLLAYPDPTDPMIRVCLSWFEILQSRLRFRDVSRLRGLFIIKYV
jgi:hypothetical protein